MPHSEIDEFLGAIRASDRTKKSYLESLALFARWSDGRLPEKQADAQHFVDHLVALGRAPHTVDVRAAAIKRYLGWKGVSVGRLEKPPIHNTPPEYLSKEDVMALLERCEGIALRCLVAVLYDTGARIGEILGLYWSDVDWDGGWLHVVRKGGQKEQCNVTPWGLRYLRQWRESATGEHPKVFGDRRYDQVFYQLKRSARLAGIASFHPHMLRHSRAVHLSLDTDLRWEEIGQQLGHKKPATTINIYGRLKDKDLKRIIPEPDL